MPDFQRVGGQHFLKKQAAIKGIDQKMEFSPSIWNYSITSVKNLTSYSLVQNEIVQNILHIDLIKMLHFYFVVLT